MEEREEGMRLSYSPTMAHSDSTGTNVTSVTNVLRYTEAL